MTNYHETMGIELFSSLPFLRQNQPFFTTQALLYSPTLYTAAHTR